MQQAEIIQQIKALCDTGKYDDAIALTNQIENKQIAVKAHLLCMEHEERSRLDADQAGK